MIRLRTWYALVTIAVFALPLRAPAGGTWKPAKQKLEQKITFELSKETPLKDVLGTLTKRYDVTFLIDAEAFEAVKRPSVEYSAVRLSKVIDVSLQTVIDRLLAQVKASRRTEKNFVRIVPLYGTEVRIDSPRQAVLIFTNGKTFPGELRWLDSEEVCFMARKFRLAQPLTYDAKYVRAVQTAEDIYVYDSEREIFESGLSHYRYDREARQFVATTRRDVQRNTLASKNAQVKLTNGFEFPALLSLRSSSDLSLSLPRKGPDAIPASYVEVIQTAGGDYHYDPHTGLFKFCPPKRTVPFTDWLARLVDWVGRGSDIVGALAKIGDLGKSIFGKK